MNAAAISTSAPDAAMPADVRWMNLTTIFLLAVVMAGLLLLAFNWALRHPSLNLRAVTIVGDVSRNSPESIRAHALSKLTGTFFTIHLDATQRAFESTPWVRKAVVQRVWPWQISVQLEEHRPVAIWAPDENTEELVNSYGEVFEANVGDVEDEGLPVFSGTAATSAQVLQMYRALEPALSPLQAQISAISLSSRGSWRIELDTGASLELGRGSQAEVLERLRLFILTLPSMTPHRIQNLESADLRHRDGYAFRMRPDPQTAASNSDLRETPVPAP
jgi:cell division protein FtsQ